MSKPQNIFIRLFYSKRCKECMNLIQVIQNEGITRMFIPVCLDDYNTKQLATLSIKKIPAIVISQENTQSMIFEGAQKCSEWLTTFTINRRKNLAAQVEAQRSLIQKENNMARMHEGGALEYSEAEMDGVSDSYAYEKIDVPQPKNFVMVGDEEKCNIVTLHLDSAETKINNETMRRQISEIEASRRADNDSFMKIMEREQIKKVIDNKY